MFAGVSELSWGGDVRFWPLANIQLRRTYPLSEAKQTRIIPRAFQFFSKGLRPFACLGSVKRTDKTHPSQRTAKNSDREIGKLAGG